jgi:hypothetical protein
MSSNIVVVVVDFVVVVVVGHGTVVHTSTLCGSVSTLQRVPL